MKYYPKPPIGIYPKYLWEIRVLNNRREELKEAIVRYLKDRNFAPPAEWWEELKELNKEIIKKENLSYIDR